MNIFGRKEKSVGQKMSEARSNPDHPEHKSVTASDRLWELHESYCKAKGVDPYATPVSETMEAIQFIDRQEKQNPPRKFK